MTTAKSLIFLSNGIEIREQEFSVVKDGDALPVEPRAFRVLIYLVRNPQRLITKDELLQSVWGDVVVTENSLARAILKLRQCLGDDARSPQYIETVTTVGYRWVCPVEQSEGPTSIPALPEAEPAPPPNVASVAELAVRSISSETRNGLASVESISPSPPLNEIPPASRRTGRPIALVGSIVGLIVLAAIGWLVWQRTLANRAPAPNGNQLSSTFQMVPVTTAPGNAIFPILSPDGREIAYIWDGAERKRYDVYVQIVGADLPLRLTYSKSGLVGPSAWSPDGREIAFSRCDGKNDGVYVVPALGGDERELTSVGCFQTRPGPLAWLSDGKEMLMIDRCQAAGPFGVVLFSIATGEKQCIAKSGLPNDSDAGLWFSLSPDGGTIAFTPANALQRHDIYTIPLSGGTPRRLTTEGRSYFPMWTPDSKSIVFLSDRSTLLSLWRVSANGGPIERETRYPAIGSFSKDGQRLVYAEKANTEVPAIWRADLATAGGRVLENRKVIQTQYWELDAQPSPDGARIVWQSRRTGFAEIWMSGAAGGSPLQLTHIGRYSGTPRWSPDGKWIAFDSITRSGTQIFTVDSQGRNLHSITGGSYDNVVPSWSRDGRSIYFSSNRTGSWQIWKHSLDGRAEVQVSGRGGFDPFESYDGQTIYFSKFDGAGVWSVPSSGGVESSVVADKPQVGYWGHWAVTKTGLYLLNVDADPKPRIEFYDFATRRIAPVLTFEKQPVDLQPSLSATADGKTVYYTQADWQSVIKVMEISR